jgi:hypothetical protein
MGQFAFQQHLDGVMKQVWLRRAKAGRPLHNVRRDNIEVRRDHPLPGMSGYGSLPREDAFYVGLHLRDFPGRKYWEDGRQAPVHDLRAGQIVICDLKRDPVVLLEKPYHCGRMGVARETPFGPEQDSDDCGSNKYNHDYHFSVSPF